MFLQPQGSLVKPCLSFVPMRWLLEPLMYVMSTTMSGKSKPFQILKPAYKLSLLHSIMSHVGWGNAQGVLSKHKPKSKTSCHCSSHKKKWKSFLISAFSYLSPSDDINLCCKSGILGGVRNEKISKSLDKAENVLLETNKNCYISPSGETGDLEKGKQIGTSIALCEIFLGFCPQPPHELTVIHSKSGFLINMRIMQKHIQLFDM